ncbi:MAG: PHP domain-containing protein [Eubacteriales bacterium]|nr:PHP domain-containing protein [Eubacteriales bacterium]
MLYYDLHIHSCLSPCGDTDMTPNNICAMAHIKGLDCIALTDHNSTGNVRAMYKAAQKFNINFIAGIELNTAEEVHLLAYFPNVSKAESFNSYIAPYRLHIKNKAEFFGEQYYVDENDDIIKTEEDLLISPLTLPFDDAVKKIRSFGGVPVPAHIFRSSGLVSMLGFIPESACINTVEITKEEKAPQNYKTLISSDAHYLGDISERENALPCENNTAEILAYLDKYM